MSLLGESFGGALTLSYALAHPERVERLVILNSFAHFGSQARLWLGYHLLRATPWGMMRIVRQLNARRMHSPQTERDEIRRFHELMRVDDARGLPVAPAHPARLRHARPAAGDRRAGALPRRRSRHAGAVGEQARLMSELTPRGERCACSKATATAA